MTKENGLPPDIDSIIVKIQKLLSLSDSPNENEAAQAAAKATELLQKYNLSMETVDSSKIGETGKVERQRHKYAKSKRRTRWEVDLSSAVADANFCKCLYGFYHITFIGKPHNIKVARYMFEQLAERLYWIVYEKTQEWGKETKQQMADEQGWNVKDIDARSDIYPHPTTWRANWLDGAVSGINRQLFEQRRTFEKSSKKANALMVITGKEIEAFMEENYPKLGSISFDYGGAYDAYNRGHSYGREMSISKGIESSGGSKKLK